jgi:hypothetical protein
MGSVWIERNNKTEPWQWSTLEAPHELLEAMVWIAIPIQHAFHCLLLVSSAPIRNYLLTYTTTE